MNICLIIPSLDNGKKNLPIYSSTLPVLASICMKHKNVRVMQIDMNLMGETIESTVQKIHDMQADVVGISPSAFSIQTSIRISERIKSIRPQIMIIFGGNYTTMFGSKIHEKIRCIDYSLHGHAFDNLPELLNCIENKENRFIPGVVRKTETADIQNKIDIEPLTYDGIERKFDFFAYDGSILKIPGIIPSYISSYGCNKCCSFCTELKDVHQYPFSAVERAITFFKKRGFKFIWNNSANLFQENIEDFCDYLISRDCCIPFFAMGNIDDFSNLEERVIIKLKKIGLRSILFGVETASSRIKKIIHKIISNEKIIDVLKKAQYYGFDVLPGFIMYFPFSQWEDIDENLELLKNIVDMNIFLPYEFFHSEVAVYPGTKLVSDLKKMNLLLTDSSLGCLPCSYQNLLVGEFARQMIKYQDSFNPIDIQLNSMKQLKQIEISKLVEISRLYLNFSLKAVNLAKNEDWRQIDVLARETEKAARILFKRMS